MTVGSAHVSGPSSILQTALMAFVSPMILPSLATSRNKRPLCVVRVIHGDGVEAEKAPTDRCHRVSV